MAGIKKYTPEFHNAWAFSLAIRGATDQDIADAFGVARRTIQRWSYDVDENGKKVLTEFGKILQTGKEIADAKVERSLFDTCFAHEVKEVRQTLNHDSTGKSWISKTEIFTKHIPANNMAIMYWLNNRSRKTGDWSMRQNIEIENSEGVQSFADAIVEAYNKRHSKNNGQSEHGD